MVSRCDFPECDKKAEFDLWYGLSTSDPPEINYRGDRCKEHILSMKGMNHLSCGLPEEIWEIPGGTRFDR
jgi:hypothetical protein